MKKLIIVLIVLLFSVCNKPNEKPEVADKIVADTTKEEIADDTTVVEDTIVSEFTELHNLTWTYKLTKKRLYCYSSANDTVSVERVYLDSVKLDKDSVWLKTFYTMGHNLAEFARLLLADKDISNRKSDYFAVAYHDNYYDSLINCCTAGEHEAAYEPKQYNVWFLLTKLGPQYLKVYDRLMELTNEVMFGLWGFFLDDMHGQSVGFDFYDKIESVIVKLYDDVNNGVDVLNVSTDFQKRKKQFIKKLNAFNKNMLIELQEIGSSEGLWANAVKDEWSRCKESTYKISKLIYNDYLLEYAFFLAHCYPYDSHEHNLYPTWNPDKQN